MSRPTSRRYSILKPVRLLALVGAGLLAATSFALPSWAEGPVADAYVFEGQLAADGVLHARQTITFTQAPDELTQRLALEAPIDQHRAYAYEITNLAAEIDGAAVTAEATRDGDYLVVAVDTAGASGKPVVISYDVVGTTRADGADGATLFSWRVLQGLSVEVAEVSGTMQLPSLATMVDCVAGPPGGLQKCDLYAAGTAESPMPTFRTSDRGVGEQVTLTLGLPTGAVAATAVVHEDWNLNRAFTVSPATTLAALAALLLGGLGLYGLFRRLGRDVAHDGEFETVASFRPVGEGASVFETNGVRPGHVGTVADERVDPVDVTATLLDLAVRGHLRITELPRDHGVQDWRIARLAAGGDEPAPFERRLLEALAPAGGETLVSTLPTTLVPAVGEVQDALYDDVVAQGWFEARPDATRSRWRRAGLLAMAAALVAAVLLVAFTRFGLLAVVLVLLAAGVLWAGNRMPRRTRKGARLLAGLGALGSLLATHPTDQMPKGRELAEISRVLPFAVVLGGRQRWLDAMAQAGDAAVADGVEVAWYHAPDDWTLAHLPASLTNFVNTVQGVLVSR